MRLRVWRMSWWIWSKITLRWDKTSSRIELYSRWRCFSGKLTSYLALLQDVRVLYKQISGHEVDEPDAPTETSLDQILDFIRSHWEKVIERNRAETDAFLERKVIHRTKALKSYLIGNRLFYHTVLCNTQLWMCHSVAKYFCTMTTKLYNWLCSFCSFFHLT